LYFWFDGFESGDWVIAGPRLDVRQKYRIYTILGEKKKEQNLFFFFLRIKNYSHVALITRGYKCPIFLENKIAFSHLRWHVALITRGYKCPIFLENKIAFSHLGWHVAKRHLAK
jgi:hypothetical protein